MKTLFIGGIKSGKSRLAEAYILEQSKQKPYYLATTEFIDKEMALRIAEHQQRRQDRFIILEEPVHLRKALSECSSPVLIECVSMWLNNMIFYKQPDELIFQELEAALLMPLDLVFVQNEVGLGIVPDNALARKYIDISGKCAQMLAAHCDMVFYCCAGLSLTLK
ncbi:adenosylcobinamide kinase / adenosylcobinamide-phosphate guanylyltransferase [biofilm metagenome]